MFKKNMKWLGSVTLRGAAVLLAVETAAILSDAVSLDYSASETALALLIAAFMLGTFALLAFVVLGPIAAYGTGTDDLAQAAAEGFRATAARLRVKDREARRAFMAGLVSRLLWLSALFLLAVPPVALVVARIQTPLYAAVLAVLLTAGAGGVALAARPVWRRIGGLATRWMRHPASPLAVVATLVLTAAAVAAVVSILTWETFAAYLPWRPLVVNGTAAALFAVYAVVTQYRPIAAHRRVRQALVAAAIALYLAGAVVSVVLPASEKRAAYLVEDATGVLSVTYSLATRAADADGDGYLPWLAQGDCAPQNSAIHPGAVDRPKDGIDQDCDGEDNRGIRGGRPGRHDYAALPRPRPMPVILVTVDAVSALHMELYGAERKTMPFLTRKAKEGVVFNHAFSEGPATRLSFPSILSGRHNTQIRRERSPRTTVPWVNIRNTLGAVFSGAGYRTLAVSPDTYFSKVMRWLYKGFDIVDDSAVKGPCGKYKNGRDVTRAALKRLDDLKAEEKFLLWVHYTDAHYPHRVPGDVDLMFGNKEADIYDRELRLLDDALEPLFKGIAERMKHRQHIIALTADHGQAFDEKHEKWHQDHDLSTAVTKVPMIFWSPYGKGRRSDQLAQIIDVMPTLMNMVGVEAEGIAGESLLPAIQGRPDLDRAVMQQFYLHERMSKNTDPLVATAVRKGPYVLHQRGARNARLYDFKKDPWESDDLAERLPQKVKELSGLRDAILDWAYEEWNKPEK